MKIWWDEKNEEFIIKNKEEEDTTSSRSKYKKKLKVRVENIKNCVQQVKLISITHIMTHLTNIRIKV